VPTIAESVLPDFDASFITGWQPPAGTPRPIIDKLNKHCATRRLPRGEAQLTQDGTEITPGTPEDYAAFIDKTRRNGRAGQGQRRRAGVSEGIVGWAKAASSPVPTSNPMWARHRRHSVRPVGLPHPTL